MKTLRAKLKSRSGESLAEVLIALLVSALALVILASMISSSFNIVTTSRKKLKEYYEYNKLAVPADSTKTATVGVSFDGSALTGYTVQYEVYSDLGHEDIVSYVPAA